MDVGHPRRTPHVRGAVSTTGVPPALAELLTAAADGEVAVGPGAIVNGDGGCTEAVLLLDADARDHPSVAAFAAALIAGAQEAQRNAGARRTA